MATVNDATPVVRQANMDAATAWESGHLIFRGEPLADAVRRVNRYTANPVTVDASAASIPISGVFNAGDVGTFVSAITGYFPVDATTDSENRIRLQKRT
jgi:transmembrane sensor